MGAVSAILFAQSLENQKLINGLILDSPFSNFKKMVHDVVAHNSKVPGCFVTLALKFLMSSIKKKTGVNLMKIKPIKCVDKINLPAFYLVCKDDIIARPDKVKSLYM